METNINCVKVIFDNECTECGETLDGTDRLECQVLLTSLLEGGIPTCSCGTEFEWTEHVEIRA